MRVKRTPSEMNPKAREAFAKSGIDVGVAIFKAVLLVVLVLPLTLIIKSIVEGGSEESSIFTLLGQVGLWTWFMFLLLVYIGLLAGFYFRDKGVAILHDMEESDDTELTETKSA